MTHIVEYRGYSQYDIDALTNSGQAAAMGHGPGREGAYNWIDSWYDVHGFKLNGKFYPKQSDDQRAKILSESNKAYLIRRKEESAVQALHEEYSKWH